MADAKPLPLPSGKSKLNQNSGENVSLLNEEVHLMTELPWDSLRGSNGIDLDALSSDEELLDFTSDQSRLVLNSSSDDDLLDVSPDGRNSGDVRRGDKVKLSRYQECYRMFADHVGLLYAFISCVFFATSTICVKLLTGKSKFYWNPILAVCNLRLCW